MLDSYVAYALGPELAWVLVLLVTQWLVARNKPPTVAGNQLLETMGYCLPLLGLILSFSSIAWTSGSVWWWLMRIVLASAVGILIISSKICNGIDYQDSRNSGVGTGFILCIGLGLLELLISLAIAVFFLATPYAFLPFLKWLLLIVGALVLLWKLLIWVASLGEK